MSQVQKAITFRSTTKANPLLSLGTQGGSLLYSKASPLLSLCTLGGRRANLLCSKVNPLSALIIHLDKLANLRVNQLFSRLSHPFRKDNPWWSTDNLAPSKFIMLASRVHLKSNQVNLRAR